jgi:hypothetical protein
MAALHVRRNPVRLVWHWLRPIRWAWRWFRAFRRTRPFWGGLWLGLGGWDILRFNLGPLHAVVAAAFNGVAGWLIGGGMILCALIAWAAPQKRVTVGVIGTILAVVSLIASNLGGFFLGLILGVVGGAMTVAWGPKKPRRSRKPLMEAAE